MMYINFPQCLFLNSLFAILFFFFLPFFAIKIPITILVFVHFTFVVGRLLAYTIKTFIDLWYTIVRWRVVCACVVMQTRTLALYAPRGLAL